jgi:hypothetical protein
MEAGSWSTATQDAPHRSSCRAIRTTTRRIAELPNDGERVSAIVAQITTKKPIYKKQLEKLGDESLDVVCAPPL